MTIAVTVRTGSAVVFAADSKVTTSGIVGFNENGDPKWVEQTYDNATKVVHDHSQTIMAMVAGHANISQESAMDFFLSRDLQDLSRYSDQDQRLSTLIDSMVDQKKKFWENIRVSADEWRGPVILLAGPSTSGNVPRIWRIDLEGSGSQHSEVLKDPGIYLEGSYNESFGLLYGYEPSVLEGLRNRLGIDHEALGQAVQNLHVLRPIDKLSLWSMPLQDAIELAVFLVTVQIQMDRFLPGTLACGGPIDVMVLQTVPTRAIISLPDKKLHHALTQ